MTRNLIIIAASSVVHFALTFSLFFYAISAGFATFKPHRAESWPLVDAAAATFELLSQPGWTLLNLSPGRYSLSFELLVFTTNSLLWGCGVFCVMESFRAVFRVAGFGKKSPRGVD